MPEYLPPVDWVDDALGLGIFFIALFGSLVIAELVYNYFREQ